MRAQLRFGSWCTFAGALFMCAGMAYGQSPAPSPERPNISEIRKTTPPRESVHLKPSLPADSPQDSATAAATRSPWDMATAPTTLHSLQVSGDALQVTITLGVQGHGRLRSFVVPATHQVLVEGEGLVFSPGLAEARLQDRLLVSDFRFGAIDQQNGRLVFDLMRAARITAFEKATDQTVTLKLSVGGSATETQNAFSVDLSLPSEAAWTTITPPAPDGRRKRVMIDPGHGGKDPGAVTETGVFEKDVVLAVAKRLQGALAATKRYDVVLTREADTSVTLDRRLAMSRTAQADLFISLHADTFAGQPQAAAVRGGAVYILSDRASNRLAATLADKENAADTLLGADIGPLTGDTAVDKLLQELTNRETQSFATDIQSGLIRFLKGTMQLARDPARGAAFKVLKQAGTPAVLIELGYMSHAEDVVLLQSAAWQEQVASAISKAVDGYFAKPRSIVPGAAAANR
jgi:N-acetylmuramoyl-L-alanine amidase